MTIRVSTSGGLSVSSVRLGPLQVSNGWTEVDPHDPKVRETLIRFIPTHLRIHPDDVKKLGEIDLKLEGGKLVNTTEHKPGDDKYQRPPKPGEPQPQPEPPMPVHDPLPVDPKNRRGR